MRSLMEPRTFVQELGKLYQLKKGSTSRKVADYEGAKYQIAEIFENIKRAKVLFEVRS